MADGVTGAEEPAGYAPSADFFFQVVFVATAMSIVSGAVAERMKLFAFLAFAVVMTAVIYPLEGSWTWGGNDVFGLYNLGDLGFSGLRWIWHRSHGGRGCRCRWCPNHWCTKG